MKEYWTPCSPGDPSGVPMTWMEVPGDDLMEPIVSKVCVVELNFWLNLVFFRLTSEEVLLQQDLVSHLVIL